MVVTFISMVVTYTFIGYSGHFHIDDGHLHIHGLLTVVISILMVATYTFVSYRQWLLSYWCWPLTHSLTTESGHFHVDVGYLHIHGLLTVVISILTVVTYTFMNIHELQWSLSYWWWSLTHSSGLRVGQLSAQWTSVLSLLGWHFHLPHRLQEPSLVSVKKYTETFIIQTMWETHH